MPRDDPSFLGCLLRNTSHLLTMSVSLSQWRFANCNALCIVSVLLSLINKVNTHNDFKALGFFFVFFNFYVNMWWLLCVCVCVSVGAVHRHTLTHTARERCPPYVVLKSAHHRSAFCFTRLPVQKRKWLNYFTVVQERSPDVATHKLRAHTHTHTHRREDIRHILI